MEGAMAQENGGLGKLMNAIFAFYILIVLITSFVIATYKF